LLFPQERNDFDQPPKTKELAHFSLLPLDQTGTCSCLNMSGVLNTKVFAIGHYCPNDNPSGFQICVVAATCLKNSSVAATTVTSTADI
jgi:hypothetical protein